MLTLAGVRPRAPFLDAVASAPADRCPAPEQPTAALVNITFTSRGQQNAPHPPMPRLAPKPGRWNVPPVIAPQQTGRVKHDLRPQLLRTEGRIGSPCACTSGRKMSSTISTS